VRFIAWTLVLAACAIAALAWAASRAESGKGGATLPARAPGLPRADADCASRARSAAPEPMPRNRRSNATVPAEPVEWSSAPEQTRWRRWIAKRSQVSGRFTGTTEQIMDWAACKWGLDRDLVRAVAQQESGWDQGTAGDGGRSFGIMQIRDRADDGSPAWGGYPDTRDSTALNVDFYGAYLRACLDGDFSDGGPWLYGGKTIEQVIADAGFEHALWGCVGSWYSGAWHDAAADRYIDQVRDHLAAADWPGDAG
jgi:hypothetical protein